MDTPYGFVYETINNINGMKYIGKCIYGRKNDWQTYLGSGLYLKRAIKKYGKENFSRRILEEANSHEELNRLEEYYIVKHNAVTSVDYYNVKHTSIGGDVFTANPLKEEIRNKRVLQMTGEGNHQYGKPKTDKMIQSAKEANSKKVQIDEIVYESASEASRVLGLNATTILYRIDCPNFSNYKRLVQKRQFRSNTRAAYKCQIDDKIYSSIAEAAKEHDISIHAMRYRMYSKNFPNHTLLSKE